MKKGILLGLFLVAMSIVHGQYLTSSNLPIVSITTDNGANIPD